MEFVDYIAIARRRWLLLAASLVLGLTAAYAVSRVIPPEYHATATLAVLPQQQSDVVHLGDIQAGERLTTTFSRLILLEPVLSDAAAVLGPSFDSTAVADALTVAPLPGTTLLEVTAVHRDPAVAADLANAVSNAFVASQQASPFAAPTALAIMQPALSPLEPSSPRVALNLALGALAGLLVGGLGASLLESRDDKVRKSSDVARAGLTALGQIPRFERGARAKRLPLALEPGSTVAEAYRGLRTTLTYALDLAGGSRVLLVTSAAEGDGKSTTVTNLGVAFGLAGRRTVVVDADLRRPSLHELLGKTNTTGLADALGDSELRPSRFLKTTQHANVALVSAGPPPLNPSELLGSARMEQLLKYLRAQFDVVLIDTPPALAATDASVLAELADASLIVTTAGRGTMSDIASVAEILGQSGRPVLGVVINGASRGELPYATSGAYRSRTPSSDPAPTAIAGSRAAPRHAFAAAISADAPSREAPR